MQQDPNNPYVFYTADGELIRILVTAIHSYPFVTGSGPPTFYAHPANPDHDTRLFTFTEANPPNVDAVELIFSFPDPEGKDVVYKVQVSGSGGGGTFDVPEVFFVPGLVLQHMGLLFLAAGN